MVGEAFPVREDPKQFHCESPKGQCHWPQLFGPQMHIIAQTSSDSLVSSVSNIFWNEYFSFLFHDALSIRRWDSTWNSLIPERSHPCLEVTTEWCPVAVECPVALPWIALHVWWHQSVNYNDLAPVFPCIPTIHHDHYSSETHCGGKWWIMGIPFIFIPYSIFPLSIMIHFTITINYPSVN